AVEAGAHAYAARDGHYRSMTTWSVDENGHLVGELELPMDVGTVGGATRVHPMAKLAPKTLGTESAGDLAQIIVAVGLGKNLVSVRACVTDGIQQSLMALHSRSGAIAAGATGEMIDIISQQLIEANDIRVGKAKELVAEFNHEC